MLVGAFAVAHTPQRLARPWTEDRELVRRVHAAFARVKRRLEALRPDAIAMIAGDHIEAFFLSAVPALAVYVGTECAGTFGRYRYRFPIHEPLARALVEAGIERGFDLVYTQDAPLDYAFYVPLHFTMPEPSVPLVPLHVNVYLPPQPTPKRCYEWGRALGEILGSRSERVVLMASGGMSHFPGTDRYASPEFDYDRRLLDLLSAGRSPALAGDTDDAFRLRFRTDARAAMREMELDDADAAALLRGERDALVARGAHPYLVFMADLRLRMEREAVTFEYF